jgi:ABC-type phosphate transport system substrate-binding protein
MAGNEQIASEVSKNPNGIGYVGLAYMKSGGVKTLPIDGAMPSAQSVLAKTWPYARPRSTTQTATQAASRSNSSTSPSAALARRS